MTHSILKSLFFLLTVYAAAAHPLPAQQRFPTPEFESGYSLPKAQTHPQPHGPAREIADIAFLLTALSLISFFSIRGRSRKAIFLVMIASLLYLGFWRKGCICPIGAIQNIALTLADPSHAVPLSVIIFFFAPLIFALFFGRAFCGGVCPLGALQDLFVIRPLKIPAWAEQGMSMLPVIFLGTAVVLATTGTGFIICALDPLVPIFRMSGTAAALAAGGILLIIGMGIARPYCRFVCPYAVLLKWMSALSRFRVTVTPDECIQCGLCENVCPFDAIRKPGDTAGGESRGRGLSRIAVLLVLLPLLMIGGAWIGGRIAPVFAAHDPNVRLLQLLDAEQTDPENLEVRAFRQTQQTTESVRVNARKAQLMFSRRFRLLGTIIGLIVILKLLILSLKRNRIDYEPDPSLCMNCGRCFAYCPIHQKEARSSEPSG